MKTNANLRISVIPHVNGAIRLSSTPTTAIVIDVLRATSNMITAFVHGCISITAVETIEQALRLKKTNNLLCGERNCLKIDGFDLGNSCHEYASPQVKNKQIIMTTTNGTRAIQQANSANHVLIAAFLNVKACAAAALGLEDDICILCAGTEKNFSLEDGLCAGYFIDECVRAAKRLCTIDDIGVCLRNSYLQVRRNIEPTLMQCTNGRKLKSLGFSNDVSYCAQQNTTSLVPVLKRGEMRLSVLNTLVLHTLSKKEND